MSKRVCLYCRVSKSSQSVERQISELEIVADRNDWEIVDRYIDHGISGSKGRDVRFLRPALIASNVLFNGLTVLIGAIQ